MPSRRDGQLRTDRELLELVYQRAARRRARRASLVGGAVFLTFALVALVAVGLTSDRGGSSTRIASSAAPPPTPATDADAPTTTSAAPAPSTSPPTTGPTTGPPTTTAATQKPTTTTTALKPHCDGPPLPLTAPPAQIEVTLTLDRITLSKGQTLTMTAAAKNTSAQPYDHYRGGGGADYWITGPGGVIWRDSHHTSRAAMSYHETFAPGEAVTDTQTWAQVICAQGNTQNDRFRAANLPPGQYQAQTAWYDDFQMWESQAVTFTISG